MFLNNPTIKEKIIMQINIGEMIVNLPPPYGDINFYYRPANWSLEEHSHRYYQIILVTNGILTIRTQSNCFDFSEGDLCIIPPEVCHSLYSKKGYDQFGINLVESKDERGILSLLQNHIEKFNIFHKSDWFNVLPIIQKEVQTFSQLSRCKISSMLDNLLLSCIEESVSKNKKDFGKQLLEYLNRRIHQAIKLSEIAEEFSLSQTQLERLCNKEFGCSVLELFNRLKMNKACTLLLDSAMSINDISEYLGFCEQTYFCRFFKKRIGITPSSYRKRQNH
jgi:AraC-like DNA-binding protein